MISGFIIAQVTSSPKFNIPEYLYRRFMRIFPLYWLVMSCGIYYYVTRNWFAYGIENLGNYGMIKSFLIFPLKDYPFWEPGWSLEHEIIFYILAAILVPCLGLNLFSTFMIALWLIGMNFTIEWDYHLFSDYQIFFAMGILAYTIKNIQWHITLIIAITSLLLSYTIYYQILSGPSSLLYAIGSSCLIMALTRLEKEHLITIPKVISIIGDASFSIYLWH